MIPRHILSFFMIMFFFVPALLNASEDYRKASLNEVASMTLQNNYDIRTSRLDEKINSLNLDLPKAIYDGILSFKTGYSIDKTETTIGQFFGTDNRRFNYELGFKKQFSTGTGLSLAFVNTREKTNSEFVSINPNWESYFEFGINQPLLNNFAGLAYRLGVDIARHDVEIGNLGLLDRIEGNLFEVTQIYWNLYRAKTNLEILKKTLEKTKKLLENARSKRRRGLFEKVDVYAFEALYSQREGEVILAENDYENAIDRLKFLTGSGNESPSIMPSEKPQLKDIKLSYESHAKEAFKRRRDYLRVKKSAQKNSLELKMYKNSRYPRLDLLTSLRVNGISGEYGKALADVPQFSNPLWFIGIEFDWNVDNREARANYSRAKLQKAQNLIELKRIEAKIEEDLKIAIRRIETGIENVKKTRETKKYQELKLSEEEKRFSMGRSTSETVINYEQDLLIAQLAETITLVEYEQSILNLLFVKNVLVERFLN